MSTEFPDPAEVGDTASGGAGGVLGEVGGEQAEVAPVEFR
jgi:hypothetical protein